ncbi:hypothetical protein A3Q56_06941 [Intoshia linei]|uniref:Uncharacterized protein n=1 Tax=Intoshia linei TaxID=1819745 RepID=A0A177AVW5_9BILA|nr:hypothetical protein A3Q56_06941 [Intoshia linei]
MENSLSNIEPVEYTFNNTIMVLNREDTVEETIKNMIKSKTPEMDKKFIKDSNKIFQTTQSQNKSTNSSQSNQFNNSKLITSNTKVKPINLNAIMESPKSTLKNFTINCKTSKNSVNISNSIESSLSPLIPNTNTHTMDNGEIMNIDAKTPKTKSQIKSKILSHLKSKLHRNLKNTVQGIQQNMKRHRFSKIQKMANLSLEPKNHENGNYKKCFQENVYANQWVEENIENSFKFKPKECKSMEFQIVQNFANPRKKYLTKHLKLSTSNDDQFINQFNLNDSKTSDIDGKRYKDYNNKKYKMNNYKRQKKEKIKKSNCTPDSQSDFTLNFKYKNEQLENTQDEYISEQSFIKQLDKSLKKNKMKKSFYIKNFTSNQFKYNTHDNKLHKTNKSCVNIKNNYRNSKYSTNNKWINPKNQITNKNLKTRLTYDKSPIINEKINLNFDSTSSNSSSQFSLNLNQFIHQIYTTRFLHSLKIADVTAEDYENKVIELSNSFWEYLNTRLKRIAEYFGLKLSDVYKKYMYNYLKIHNLIYEINSWGLRSDDPGASTHVFAYFTRLWRRVDTIYIHTLGYITFSLPRLIYNAYVGTAKLIYNIEDNVIEIYNMIVKKKSEYDAKNEKFIDQVIKNVFDKLNEAPFVVRLKTTLDLCRKLNTEQNYTKNEKRIYTATIKVYFSKMDELNYQKVGLIRSALNVEQTKKAFWLMKKYIFDDVSDLITEMVEKAIKIRINNN